MNFEDAGGLRMLERLALIGRKLDKRIAVSYMGGSRLVFADEFDSH
jgi:hypothetical protein